MLSLLDRADNAISATTLVRNFGSKLKDLITGKTDRYVVFKDNQPAAVIVSVQSFQDMQDELENLRIEAIARDRLKDFDESTAISHEDMRARFQRGN